MSIFIKTHFEYIRIRTKFRHLLSKTVILQY